MFFDSLAHITKDGKWFHTSYDASIECLIRECKKANVTHSLLVGLPGIIDNDFILKNAKESNGLFVPIAGFNPTEYSNIYDMYSALQILSKKGFKGIKLHPRFGKYHPLKEEVKWTIQIAKEYNLVVLICTVWAYPVPPLKFPTWEIIDELCRIDQDTKIIFLHGGYWDFLATIDTVKGYRNILLDLSYTFLRYQEVFDKQFLYVVEKYDKKIVLGSDFPENTFSEVLEAIRKLCISEEKLKNILSNNLKRFLFYETK